MPDLPQRFGNGTQRMPLGPRVGTSISGSAGSRCCPGLFGCDAVEMCSDEASA
jgi:hypothetical protein